LFFQEKFGRSLTASSHAHLLRFIIGYLKHHIKILIVYKRYSSLKITNIVKFLKKLITNPQKKDLVKLIKRLKIIKPKKGKAEIETHKGFKQFSQEHILKEVSEYWKKFRYFNEIKRMVDFRNKRILDVGCGSVTSVVRLVKNAEEYGVDPLMAEYRKFFSLDKSVSWVCAVGENLPFVTDAFDIVFSSNALDHTDNPVQTMSEIRRILKKGGYFVLTVEVFPDHIKPRITEPFSFTEKDVKKLLTGFHTEFNQSSEMAGILRYMQGYTTPTRRELISIGKLDIKKWG